MSRARPLWREARRPASLAADEIHVWRIPLDGVGPSQDEAQALLSADEQERWGRFHFARDRRRFERARVALRVILAAYLDEEARRIRFAFGTHGKPELAEPSGEVGFNLSHSGDLALLAVAGRREVGVDVEAVRPVCDAEAIAERFFSPAENAALRQLPPQGRLDAFFRCWTRKEAYLKALGEGLARPLDGFDVSLEPDAPARLLKVHADPQEASRWWLTALEPGPGYVGALAACGRGWRPSLWEWPSPGRPEEGGTANAGECAHGSR